MFVFDSFDIMGAVLEEEEYYKNTYYHKYASEEAAVIFTGTNVEHDFHYTYYYLRDAFKIKKR